MTVIEREQVREVVAPVTETERRARILEAAALEIEVRGWTQGKLRDECGAVCAVGGLLYAVGRAPAVGQVTARPAAYHALDDILPFGQWADLMTINDAAQSVEYVTSSLRSIAQAVRDGRAA